MKTTIRVIVAIAALCCAVACGEKSSLPDYLNPEVDVEALIGAASNDIRTSVSFTLK
ncbi:MAG: hypothetical protein IJZ67_04110 [Alistipes sp.]|nr:hypothetical protein [Alistipes sp.]